MPKGYERQSRRAWEPAFELFYGDYLRLYRGAAQRPLFPEAEKHLLAGVEKLTQLSERAAWDSETLQRLRHPLTALYERDRVHLASRKGGRDQSDVSWRASGAICE